MAVDGQPENGRWGFQAVLCLSDLGGHFIACVFCVSDGCLKLRGFRRFEQRVGSDECPPYGESCCAYLLLLVSAINRVADTVCRFVLFRLRWNNAWAASAHPTGNRCCAYLFLLVSAINRVADTVCRFVLFRLSWHNAWAASAHPTEIGGVRIDFCVCRY